MKSEEINELLGEVAGWEVKEDSEIRKKWKFNNFAQSLDFVNKIGELAESEGHHPDIKFGWGYVKAMLTTHAIGGLSKNDFIMAAKINNL